MTASAQLSSNPDKFLGNITTSYNNDMDYSGFTYSKYWNQVTPENASKWGSVEGTRNSFSWGGVDKAFNYAKKNNFTYKFHALIWGAQYPDRWFTSSLPISERYKAIVNWFDNVKKKYPTLPMIDVVNEAVWSSENDPHQPGNPLMRESMGGKGKTGYDWLIKAFEMAFERFPNSILIYNDYNSIRWQRTQYIDLVRTLRDAGAPIDAYGLQCHELTDISLSECTSALKELDDALKMPMYSTEFDIGTADDAQQEKQYKNLIPLLWEKDYCAGVTLWGWFYGQTWTTDGNSGLIKNGKDRPAMTWLKQYMASDKAKNAKSPYPGMKKRVSVFVRPRDLKVAKGDVLPIKVRTYITDDAKAENASIAIDKVELYVGTELVSTMTEEPYIVNYEVPSNTSGTKTLKAIVYTNDGNKYERLSRINVLSSSIKREPYNETVPELPGTININEYDKGASGVSYNSPSYDYSTRKTKTATKDGTWMEYTVDVKEDGVYSFDAEVAASKAGGVFHLAEYSLDNLEYLSEFVEVPKTGGVNDFQTMHGRLQMPLTAGRHIVCLNVDKGGFYINKLTFSRYEEDKNITVSVATNKSTITVGDSAVITVTPKSTTSTIANVKVFANNLLIGTLTEAPYKLVYYPAEKGSYSITAIATDAEGKEKMSAVKTLKVNGRRVPYLANPISIPGVIQAENYDNGGEGLTYHDADEANQGDASFRTADGVDIVKGNGGKAIGYTSASEWIEYSVNVKEPGEYQCIATVSSGTTNSGFTLALRNNSVSTTLCKINVPQTANNSWDTYKTVTVNLSRALTVGEQVWRITINGANCNIDKLELKLIDTGIEDMENSQQEGNQPQYNLSGQKVGTDFRGIVIKNGRKVLKR
jgi:GH35 family endo-1,4-beta-xylanase